MHDDPATDATQEVEAKFSVDPSGRAALLAMTAAGPFRVVSTTWRQQDDVYVDTPERGLARAGATLRVRRLPDGALMTFKGAREPTSSGHEHVASRLEDEQALPEAWAARVALDRPLPDSLDISPLRRARRVAGAGVFEPVAWLRNERAIVLLRDERGWKLELALDHCRGTRLADGREIIFDEVELEAKQGGEAAVHMAHQALLSAAPGLRPSRLTKLERVLG